MITRITIGHHAQLSADLKYPKNLPTPRSRQLLAEQAMKAYDAFNKMLLHLLENPDATVSDLYAAANMPDEDVTVTGVTHVTKTTRRHNIYPHNITITEEDL